MYIVYIKNLVCCNDKLQLSKLLAIYMKYTVFDIYRMLARVGILFDFVDNSDLRLI